MKAIVLFSVTAFILQFSLIKTRSILDDDSELQISLKRINETIAKLDASSERMRVFEETILDATEMICIATTDVKKDLVAQAKKDSIVQIDTPEYKEFLSCCWRQYGYQAEDGEIDWDEIQEVLIKTHPSNTVEKVIKECDDIEGKTREDTASLVIECLNRHIPISCVKLA